MEAVLKFLKALIFACGKAQAVVGGARVEVVRGDGAANMLVNCADLVDVETAQAAVARFWLSTAISSAQTRSCTARAQCRCPKAALRTPHLPSRRRRTSTIRAPSSRSTP